MKDLRLAHLYPDLMNLYGDRGNIMVLQRRCGWRGINLNVEEVRLGEPLEGRPDLIFIGGGQDREQMLVYKDLLDKSDALRELAGAGAVILAICGGYQLLGDRFITHTGEEIEGLGLLDVTTVGGQRRLIGNVVADSELPGSSDVLVGFENHSGKTTLGPAARPLARVRTGFGNNGEDGTEGAWQDSIFGTYLHGSLLPKNPWLADHLISLALGSKYDELTDLAPLDDHLEAAAVKATVSRVEYLHRRRWLPEWLRR